MFLGADFSGLILEGPFNNFVEAASSHPFTAVCCIRFAVMSVEKISF